jgi:hypothetical protein
MTMASARAGSRRWSTSWQSAERQLPRLLQWDKLKKFKFLAKIPFN